jgi:hypothetical protein
VACPSFAAVGNGAHAAATLAVPTLWPPGGAAPGEALPDWEQFLAELEHKVPMVHATLALAKPIAFSPGQVVLGFAPGELGLAEGRKHEIERLLATAFGVARVALAMQAVDGLAAGATALSLDENNRRRAEEERDLRRTEARAHPGTHAALDIFAGAEIKDIKVDFD